MEERTALVTGASSGIGRGIALKLCQEGWRVLGTSRDVEKAREQPWPPNMEILRLDLEEPQSVPSFARQVLDRFVPDVLINNAGVLRLGSIEEFPLETVLTVFQTNLFGGLQLTQALLPSFRTRGSGIIANISSLSGILLVPLYGIYGGSKHALEAISETLWYEVRPFGIKVKLIEPGFVDTGMWERASADLATVDPDSPYATLNRKVEALHGRSGRAENCEQAAERIWRILNDPSDRLRYPICGATRLGVLRRVVGSNNQVRLMSRLLSRG